MCSVLRDKRRVRKRCVALLMSVVGKRRCGPRVSLRSDNFHRARPNKPGQVVCPSVTESEHLTSALE